MIFCDSPVDKLTKVINQQLSNRTIKGKKFILDFVCLVFFVVCEFRCYEMPTCLQYSAFNMFAE